MGHIRLGTLSRSKKWREVVELLGSNASLEDIAEASTHAAELDLARASSDPSFQFISRLLVELPLMARSPGFQDPLDVWSARNKKNAFTTRKTLLAVA